MTQDEAKTKWCPFAINGQGHIEGGDVIKAHSCVASGCMMWRYIPMPEEKLGQQVGVVRRMDGAIHADHQLNDGGYCGLAGKP